MATKKKAEKQQKQTAVAVQSGESESVLQKKAMLIKVTCHWWAPFATHKEASAEVEQSRNAKKNVGRYEVRLLGQEATGPMWSVIGEMRKLKDFITLPWDDDGWRLLSVVSYNDFVMQVNALKAKMEAEKAVFKKKYIDLVQVQEPLRLGKLYNPTVYPPVHEIDTRIGFEIKVKAIQTGQHFMADVNAEETAAIRKAIDEDAQATLKKAVDSIWVRFADSVGHMVEALEKYQPAKGKGEKSSGRFHDTVVENIVKLLDVVPVLNITGNPDVQKFADEIRAKLTVNTPQVLRDDDKVRKQVAKQAADILDKMKGYLG